MPAAMSHIDIRREHTMSRDQVRQATQKLADKLSGDLGVNCEWQGDTLCFDRPGVDGVIEVNDTHVHIKAELGLLLAAFKPSIERKVTEYLDQHLS